MPWVSGEEDAVVQEYVTEVVGGPLPGAWAVCWAVPPLPPTASFAGGNEQNTLQIPLRGHNALLSSFWWCSVLGVVFQLPLDWRRKFRVVLLPFPTSFPPSLPSLLLSRPGLIHKGCVGARVLFLKSFNPEVVYCEQYCKL